MPTPLAFAFAAVRALPIRGASGVTPSRAGLLVVEDDHGLFVVRNGRATLWAGPDLHPSLTDLEGVTTNQHGDVVWTLSEEEGTLVELRATATGPRLRRAVQLPRPGHRANKGYEGLAFLPAHLSSTGRAALVAVHEHKPRRVCIFELPGLEQRCAAKLPPDAKDALDDLADVAVDPVTGLLILLSQESRRLAVLRLEGEQLHLESTFDLPLEGKERPEGLAFLSRRRLAVVTEGPACLLELTVTRPRRARE